MDRKARWIASGALAVVVVSGGTGVAIATAARDDQPLTGSTLAKATTAALQHTGGGTVIQTEAGDVGAAYGVEIRLDDGSVVEVGLDANFEFVAQESDDDGPGDAGPNGD